MDQDDLNFDAPLASARATDPETSHMAGAVNAEVRSRQRLAVLRHLIAAGPGGSTDYETGQALGILRTSAGKRRKELCEAGRVIASDQRRLTDTGSSAIVWMVVAV